MERRDVELDKKWDPPNTDKQIKGDKLTGANCKVSTEQNKGAQREPRGESCVCEGWITIQNI